MQIAAMGERGVNRGRVWSASALVGKIA